MSTPRTLGTATRLSNGKVLLAGGYQGTVNNASAELYDPASNTWQPAASMSTGRTQQKATLLSTGEVLIAGGRAGTTLSSGAERYDPVGDTWRTVPDLSIPRLEHTATLLNDGRVLVAGGFDGSGTGNGVSSAELYTRQPPVPTTLTVPPVVHLTLVGLQIALPFKATLTRSSDGAAIAGKTVSFATGAGPACSDTTNAQGVASCTFTVSRLLGVVLGLGYSAAFGGDDDYVGSSGQGGLVG